MKCFKWMVLYLCRLISEFIAAVVHGDRVVLCISLKIKYYCLQNLIHCRGKWSSNARKYQGFSNLTDT